MNRAAELGPSKFGWWKDWRGECVAIVASGPSTSKAIVEQLRGRIHVVAIKKNVELCPWADVVYGCDGAWWKSVGGLPDYRGLRIAFAPELRALYPDINLIEIRDKKSNEILTDEPGCLGAGGNSGFQAINLAVQFGATGILLIGFDVHDRRGAHWYGRNNWAMANNPSDDNFMRWHAAFNRAAPDLAKMGVDVISASPVSALKCFRHRTVDQALVGWGL